MCILEIFLDESLNVQIPDKREINPRIIDWITLSHGDNISILISYSSSYFLGKYSLSENASCFLLPFVLILYFILSCLPELKKITCSSMCTATSQILEFGELWLEFERFTSC